MVPAVVRRGQRVGHFLLLRRQAGVERLERGEQPRIVVGTDLRELFTLLQTLFRTHPFPLWRAAELWKWACDGEYLDLIRA